MAFQKKSYSQQDLGNYGAAVRADQEARMLRADECGYIMHKMELSDEDRNLLRQLIAALGKTETAPNTEDEKHIFEDWWLRESPSGTFDKEQCRVAFLAGRKSK